MKKIILKKRKFISIIILSVMVLCSLSSIVKADVNNIIDSKRKASLEIIKYENAHGSGLDVTQNRPLKGVEFTIYKLNEENMEKTAEEIVLGMEEGTIVGLDSKSLVTDKNGIVKFDELELGRYLVAETKVPINVSVKMNPFLIDLPRTADDGQSWDYTVRIEPKNETVYGDVILNKTDKNGKTLAGTKWELQVKDNSDWVKYDYEGVLITDKQGKINITNLPVGEYRLIEIETLDGYILDQSEVKEFKVTAKDTSFTFEAINEKPEISKEVKNNSGYSEHASAYAKDEVEWKITAEVPSIIEKMDTYYITDTLPQGLEYKEDSLVIEGLTLNTHYEVEENDRIIKITFNTEELSKTKKKEVVITYKTTFTDDVSYGEALVNKADLTYTNKIDINGTEASKKTSEGDEAEVHLGAILIKKTDREGNGLAGAKFKIATTEENARDGIYVKGSDGEDLIVTSGDDGRAVFKGLKYGVDGSTAETGESQYYLVEIESPTYIDENGNEKHYNLLKGPVEVTVNHRSEKIIMATVINDKGFVLPFTGGTGTTLSVILGISLMTFAIKLNKKEKTRKRNRK